MDDVYAGFDVGEGMAGGENGFALVLLMQVSMRSAVQRERSTVHKAPQVVVFVKVCDAVLHLVRVKVRLHIRDLNECLSQNTKEMFHTDLTLSLLQPQRTHAHTKDYLIGVQFTFVNRIGVLNDLNLVLTKPLSIETLRKII